MSNGVSANFEIQINYLKPFVVIEKIATTIVTISIPINTFISVLADPLGIIREIKLNESYVCNIVLMCSLVIMFIDPLSCSGVKKF